MLLSLCCVGDLKDGKKILEDIQVNGLEKNALSEGERERQRERERERSEEK